MVNKKPNPPYVSGECNMPYRRGERDPPGEDKRKAEKTFPKKKKKAN